MNPETSFNRTAVGFFAIGGNEYPIHQLGKVMFALANGDELPEPTE